VRRTLWRLSIGIAILSTAISIAGEPAYRQAVLDDEPLFYWTFDEDGDTDPAINIMAPDRAEDELIAQGAATRVDHDAIGSDPMLGRAADFDGAHGTRFYAPDVGGSAAVPGANVVPSQLWAIEFWFQAQGDVVTGTRADYFVECIGATSNDPGIIFDYTEPNYIEMFRGERTGTAGPQIHDTAWHHAVFAFYGNRGGFGVANKREIIIDGGEFVTYSWSVAIGAADLVDNGDGTASVTPTGVPGDLVQVRVEASDGACGSIAAVHTIIVGEEEIRFVRADDNASGRVDLADPIYSLNYQFASGPAPPCMAAADTNGSGQVDLADPIFSLNYQFASGPVPPAPFPACGADPKLGLPCESFRPCQ